MNSDRKIRSTIPIGFFEKGIISAYVGNTVLDFLSESNKSIQDTHRGCHRWQRSKREVQDRC